MSILSKNLKLADHVRQCYSACPAAGIEPAALLESAYWVHVGSILRPGDKIEVMPEDGQWYAELIILNAGRFGAKVAFIREPISLSGTDVEADNDEFEVRWSGPHSKFRVIRTSDKTVVKEGFQTKEEGETWLKSHMRAMAA